MLVLGTELGSVVHRVLKNYKHSYDFLGGFLGHDAVEAERVRKSLLGKIDMEPRLPPTKLPHQRKIIEVTAKTVINFMAKKGYKVEEKEFMEKCLRAKQDVSDQKMLTQGEDANPYTFLDPKTKELPDDDEQRIAREYYEFVCHCYEREFLWT